MVSGTAGEKLYDQLENVLPELRRYARSLMGNQFEGDELVVQAVEALLQKQSSASTSLATLSKSLFSHLHGVWSALGAPASKADLGIGLRVQSYLQQVTPLSREALLLHTIEDFDVSDIAEILECTQQEVEGLLEAAYSEMKSAMSGRILVIEDEAIIAMDINDILNDLGHTVIGAAATRDQAVVLAELEKPDLILSDIQLADGSSGIDAVADILAAAGDIPVIFVTAYPERLLTGQRAEPAFVITKPYNERQIMSAVSQAMFFADTSAIKL